MFRLIWLSIMIEKCNFKSKIHHRAKPGCNLTPKDIVCPGEENCVLYQIYKNCEEQKKDNKNL